MGSSSSFNVIFSMSADSSNVFLKAIDFESLKHTWSISSIDMAVALLVNTLLLSSMKAEKINFWPNFWILVYTTSSLFVSDRLSNAHSEFEQDIEDNSIFSIYTFNPEVNKVLIVLISLESKFFLSIFV